MTSIPANDPSSNTVSITSADARMMSPAPDLDAGHVAALVDGKCRQRLDELGERLAGDHEPLHADVRLVDRTLGGGGEVAHGAAHADDPVSGAGEPGLIGQYLAARAPEPAAGPASSPDPARGGTAR